MEVNPVNVAFAFSELIISEFSSYKLTKPSDGEKLIAKELLTSLTSILTDFVLETDEQLDFNGEFASEVSSWSQRSAINDNGEAVTNNSTDNLSLKRKIEILKLVKAHPKWALTTLQRNGAKELKHRKYIKRWEKQVASGGTLFEKFESIDEGVFYTFLEARGELKCIHDIHLQQWALQEAQSFRDDTFHFKASPAWVSSFKTRHNITSRKVTKLVSRSEVRSMSSILNGVQVFQREIKELVNFFQKEYIINTDQAGFTYDLNSTRTLSFKGEKTTLATAKSPTNLSTHSYTCQYMINMAGKIVGDVFLCLQEKCGKMGPEVKANILLAPNVTVTCSTSGKLTTSLFEYFLDNVVLPEVKENFVLVLDSWAGQTNSLSYSERFGINDGPTCTLKVIPKNGTSICQPLDTTFHRQLKYFAKKLYTEAALNFSKDIHPSDEITTRNNIIRTHSLLHNQLSSEIFNDMIKYSWYSSGLTDERPLFLSVKEACFSFDVNDANTCENDFEEEKLCSCIRFLKCARCRKILCFSCFFYDYHYHF